MNNSDITTNSKGTKDKILVCPPDPNNITLIFVPLMCFVDEIEQATGIKTGNVCNLKQFVSEYMSERFLGRHRGQIHTQVEAAIRATDAWKATTMFDNSRDAKPLLMSTVTVDKCIQESKELMQSLPLYAEKILKDVCGILTEYR